METITYGIIGAGQHALRSHALPAKQLEGMELVAICDVSSESQVTFIEQYGVPLDVYSDRIQFLQSDIDAVVVATPDEYHFEDTHFALEAGKHVFVEKPAAVTEVDTYQLRTVLKQAEQNGLVVSSCHPRRFDPPFMWLKQVVPELTENLGTPIAFNFDFSYTKPARTWKHDRSLLLDHANHEIDLVNFMFGSSDFEAHRLNNTYDHYRVVGVRDDGIAFGFTGSRRLDTPKYLETTAIRFEQGEITLSSHDGIARISNHNAEGIVEINVGKTDYVSRGMASMVNFRDAVLGVKPSYLSPEDIYVNTATSVMLNGHKSWRYDSGNH